MTNHYLTTLSNVTDVGNRAEFLHPGFQSQNITDNNLRLVRNALYPLNLSREDILFHTFNYLSLIASTDFKDAVKFPDPRITYDLKTDFNYFRSGKSFDFKALHDSVKGLKTEASLVVASYLKHKGDEQYANVWTQHPNPVYALSGLLVVIAREMTRYAL